MKLKNKKTGEIGYTAVLRSKAIVVMDENAIQLGSYTSLAELNEEWEDYKPKMFYWIDYDGKICNAETGTMDRTKIKQIGNYFVSREEAEKAVEKLKAWKRLKDKGFRFLGYYHRLGETKSKGEIGFEMDDYEGTKQDLNLLFGGEE